MEKFLSVLVGIAIIFGSASLWGWVFMLWWNWLVPMFWSGAPILGFWQSLGIWLLLSIIASIFRSGKK